MGLASGEYTPQQRSNLSVTMLQPAAPRQIAVQDDVDLCTVPWGGLPVGKALCALRHVCTHTPRGRLLTRASMRPYSQARRSSPGCRRPQAGEAASAGSSRDASAAARGASSRASVTLPRILQHSKEY